MRQRVTLWGTAKYLSMALMISLLGTGKAEEFILNETLEELRSRHQIPGIGVCVLADNVVHIQTCGVRKSNTRNLISKDDLFHIGSCAKFMTACLVQMAVEEKKLKWSSTMEELCERHGLSVSNHLRTATIFDLVSCTSGLPEDRQPAAWPPGLLEDLYAYNSYPDKGREILSRRVLSHPYEGDRDGQQRYSNIGYCLLGHWLEKEYAEPFEELMIRKIFRPLDMTSAGFGAPVWVNRENQPWGHAGRAPTSEDEKADNPLALAPAGTVRMSLQDMGRWLNFVLDRKQLFNAPTFEAMLTPTQDGEYINGWITKHASWANGRIWIATGSNTQFFTLFVVAPHRNFAVAIAINSGDEAAGQLAGTVANECILRLDRRPGEQDAPMDADNSSRPPHRSEVR